MAKSRSKSEYEAVEAGITASRKNIKFGDETLSIESIRMKSIHSSDRRERDFWRGRLIPYEELSKK